MRRPAIDPHVLGDLLDRLTWLDVHGGGVDEFEPASDGRVVLTLTPEAYEDVGVITVHPDDTI